MKRMCKSQRGPIREQRGLHLRCSRVASSACGGARENTATSSPFSSSFSMPPSATAPTSSDLRNAPHLLMHPHHRAAALVQEGVSPKHVMGVERHPVQAAPCIVCDNLIDAGPAAGQHHGGEESCPVLPNLCAQGSHSEDEPSSGCSASSQHMVVPNLLLRHAHPMHASCKAKQCGKFT